MALKALLCSGDGASPQHWSVLRAIHTHYIRLFGGLSTIHSMFWRRAQGLMWGTRGPFPPVAAMVCYGCVGQCRQLEADIRSTYCRNSRNCLRKIFLFLRVSHTFLTSDPAAKKGRLRSLHSFALGCLGGSYAPSFTVSIYHI
jgi:hypothetical protein